MGPPHSHSSSLGCLICTGRWIMTGAWWAVLPVVLPISQLKLSDTILAAGCFQTKLGPRPDPQSHATGRETLQGVHFKDHTSESYHFPNECFRSRGGGKSSGVVPLARPAPRLSLLPSVFPGACGHWSPGAAPMASVDCSLFTSGHYHRSQYRHFIPRVPDRK